MIRQLRRLFGLVAVVLAAASCTGSAHETDLDGLTGTQLDLAKQELVDYDGLVIIDLSPMFEEEAEYSGSPGDDGRTIVVAACPQSGGPEGYKSVELGVTSVGIWEDADPTPQDLREYRSALNCSD